MIKDLYDGRITTIESKNSQIKTNVSCRESATHFLLFRLTFKARHTLWMIGWHLPVMNIHEIFSSKITEITRNKMLALWIKQYRNKALFLWKSHDSIQLTNYNNTMYIPGYVELHTNFFQEQIFYIIKIFKLCLPVL